MANNIKIRVVVFGPKLSGNKKGYGGGKGGIVSAMQLMVDYFKSSDINVKYVSYGVRSYHKFWFLFLPVRLIGDIGVLLANLKGANLIHVVANSGPALFRAFAATCVSKTFGLPVLLDVRGSALDDFSEQRSTFIYKIMWSFVIFFSSKVFVQRKNTSENLKSRYRNKIVHQPNMIPDEDIKKYSRPILLDKTINVIFVGYCYLDKGVFDIVEGCRIASGRGMSINLTFVGEEHVDFSEFLNLFDEHEGLFIRRLGKKDRNEVLNLLNYSDVFTFPTYHKGEGHPNVINEAMAHGLSIIATHWGAISELLNDETAYFVDAKSPRQIADTLCYIDRNRGEAKRKGLLARERLISDFTASKVLCDLDNVYRSLTKGRRETS